MQGDFLPPKRRPQAPPPAPKAPEEVTAPVVLPTLAIEEVPKSQPLVTSHPKRRLLYGILGIIAFIALVAASVVAWYFLSLRPVNIQDTNRQRITIASGSSLSSVSELLEQKHLIRSRAAFIIYSRSINAGERLQAGEYSLSPSESTKEIINHFLLGKVDQFSITFLPGATLRHLQGDTSKDRTDIESTLIDAGYSKTEVEAALDKTYDSPLFDGKPAGTDLEGYIYGETYNFASNTSVEQILTKTFDQYYQVIQDNNLIAGFQAQGLSLYQGITLASIIQREASHPADQKQVAQIFLLRIKLGMSLGSDVTYQYAAKKAGVTPTPDYDSPYNTRKYTGLPPGPIAMPGLSALEAVASPAPGDYLFFLSGDDGMMYYATTNAEHEANIRNHCQQSCIAS